MTFVYTTQRDKVKLLKRLFISLYLQDPDKAEMCNKKKILMRYSIYHIPYYLACNFLAGQHAV